MALRPGIKFSSSIDAWSSSFVLSTLRHGESMSHELAEVGTRAGGGTARNVGGAIRAGSGAGSRKCHGRGRVQERVERRGGASKGRDLVAGNVDSKVVEGRERDLREVSSVATLHAETKAVGDEAEHRSEVNQPLEPAPRGTTPSGVSWDARWRTNFACRQPGSKRSSRLPNKAGYTPQAWLGLFASITFNLARIIDTSRKS
jgi:hypothetical protein